MHYLLSIAQIIRCLLFTVGPCLAWHCRLGGYTFCTNAEIGPLTVCGKDRMTRVFSACRSTHSVFYSVAFWVVSLVDLVKFNFSHLRMIIHKNYDKLLPTNKLKQIGSMLGYDTKIGLSKLLRLVYFQGITNLNIQGCFNFTCVFFFNLIEELL